MKVIVCMVAGVAIGFLLLKVLAETVGFPGAWPIFGLAVVALGAVSFYLERHKS